MAQHSRGDLIRLIIGPLDTTPAAGAVTNEDLFGAYIKQLVTNSEWLVAALGGAAGQLRVVPSISAVVEEDSYMQFSISLMDIDTGAIALGDIDTTGISAVIERSTGGGAFAATPTAIVFGKENGRVFVDYRFLAAEWIAGDAYKIVVTGIEVAIGGDTAYVPAAVWSNLIVEQGDITADTDPQVMGRSQIAATTIDLNQGVGAKDLFTGTAQAVVLESLILRCPNIVADAPLTSITIQTDDETPGVIVNATDGAVANLTAEAQLGWQGQPGIYIPTGTKIQLTIAGGAEGNAYVCNVVAKYRAVVSGGALA